MSATLRIILITITENFAGALAGVGVFFLTTNALGFSEQQNLALQFGSSGIFIGGALSSHYVAAWISERRLLLLTIFGHLALFALMAAAPTAPVIVTCTLLAAVLYGWKWPVIESYVSAGKTSLQVARAVGRFNVAWSATMPIGLGISGSLIAWWPPSLYLLACTSTLASLWLARPLEARPAHAVEGELEHLSPALMPRYGALLLSSRWALVLSFALMALLHPLLPAIFDRLGCSVTTATIYASVLHVTRLWVFLAMQQSDRWHGRGNVVGWLFVLLPATFVMVVSEQGLVAVVLGLAVFGAAEGAAYYVALYYAMVVKKASVDAAGAHEAILSMGCAIGVGAGLAAQAVVARPGITELLMRAGPLLRPDATGLLIGIGPVVAFCTAAGLRPLRRGEAPAASPLEPPQPPEPPEPPEPTVP